MGDGYSVFRHYAIRTRHDEKMRILGIDPGLDITGYGVIEGSGSAPVLVEAGVIRTSRKDGLARRLSIISSQVSELIRQTRPEIGVVEELYSHYKHPITAVLMAHARGAVLSCCSQKSLPVVNYPAKTVKSSIAGYGNASKQQVQRLVTRYLNLKAVPKSVDITDALALCLTYLKRGHP